MTDPKRPDDNEDIQPTDSDALEETAVLETAVEPDDTELTAAEREEVEEALEAEYVAEQAASSTAPVAATKPASSRDRTGKITTPAAAAVDELPYVDDRVSKVWVVLIAAVFALILAWGLLFGQRGGLLTPTDSPEPTDSPVPSLSATPSPSRTPTVSGTPGASGSPAASPSVGPSSSPAPSPTTAPQGTPSAGPT